ncbi:hypothetical protein LA6_001357 [Marinibacterium anthonyi]|nr:hypothetical protein LA6_001357 [Marinibacterium anthonyi]
MKMSIVSAVTATALVFTPLSGAFAQTPTGSPAQAMAEARQRLVCGPGTVVDATYLTGGLLRATCQSRTTTGLPAELSGTALTAGEIAAIAAGALLVVIVATGGGGDSTTTADTGSSGE